MENILLQLPSLHDHNEYPSKLHASERSDDSFTLATANDSTFSVNTIESLDCLLEEDEECIDSLLHDERKVTNAETPRKSLSNKRVSFGKVSVRSHKQVLSCNPSCSDGPAISLGWEIESQETTTVDSAEAYRATTSRRSREDLVMERNVREERLTDLGYTVYDLVASVREITKIQNNRWQSVRDWQRQEVAKARALKVRNIINRLRGRKVETMET